MVLKEEQEFAISGNQKGNVRVETNAASGTTVMCVQNRHQKPLHPLSHQHQEVEVRRGKKNLRGRGPFGKTNRQPCKNFLKVTCTKLLCDKWHPPECQFYKSESGCKIRHRVLVCPQAGWGTTKEKAEEGWWQKCSSNSERCATVGYHRTLSRRNLERFHGRAQKSWDQFDECDSQKLRYVKQTSEKIKVHRWIKYKSKCSSSAQSVRFAIWG